ncbi:MAG: helix-turn-helix domain-containing protein [Acidimicrobiales bacterium]
MTRSKSPEPPDNEAARPPTLEEARALAHPLRLRILRLCLDEPMTNRQLATALGQRPATVLHHVRTLLSNGFLVEQPWRQGPRGSVEKPYLSTGKSWELEGGMDLGSTTSRMAVFEAVSAEIGEGGPDSVIDGARLATRLRPDKLDELVGRIRDLIDEYRAADTPDGDPYAMLVVLHRRQKDSSTS